MQLCVLCRPATKKELEKEDATLSLLRAMTGTRHSALHACLVRGRAALVEQSLLERGSAKLLRLKVAHPDEARLKKLLQWKLVTTGTQGKDPATNCALPNCGVGQPKEGSVMTIDPNSCTEALQMLPPKMLKHMKDKGVAVNDEWMFKVVADAAAKGGGPMGGVWFTGKHIMLSNPNRNQSPVALCSFLDRIDCLPCSKAIQALVTFVELKYSKSVSAVQVNLHLDGNSCHKQHHDIYSIKQRANAGRDCTCSFKNNVATACFSLGSSRRVKLNAQRGGGECNKKKRCCEECVGVSRSPFLHSGDLMYFNDKWNARWTHGIPKHDVDRDGTIGPRISIALLCAEADPSSTLERLNKYL